MDSSLLVSESVFVKIPNGSPETPNYHDSIEEVCGEFRSLSWDQLISLDLEQPSINDSKTGRVRLTKSEALNLLNIAATLLQRNIRRYFQQQKYKSFLGHYKAAVKIQSAWRGYRTRNLDMKVLQLKHFYMMSKLQQRIQTINKVYTQEIDYLTENRQLMIRGITLLCNEIENFRDLSSTGFKFSKDNLISSIELKESDQTTPTNDESAFYVNNPHLMQSESGWNFNMTSPDTNINNTVTNKEIQMDIPTQKEVDCSASLDSDKSEVIPFAENEIKNIVLANANSCQPSDRVLNDEKHLILSSIAIEEDGDNPLDLVDGIKVVDINDIVLCDKLDAVPHPDTCETELHEQETLINGVIQADNVEAMNDSLHDDNCLDTHALENKVDCTEDHNNDDSQIFNDSLQMDNSTSLNPIEADSLQFIQDSLQVD